jgi:hypothetical protein
MSIIRTKSPHRFTIVSNELLAEKNPLSWEATGVLVYLLSKPDNWKVSIAALTNIGKSGKTKIENILKELKQLGYIVGKRHHTGKYDYYVYDTPQSPEFTPEPENQVKAKPKPEKPKPENPEQENPEQGFQVLINTNNLLTNTEKTTTTRAPEQNAAPKLASDMILSAMLKGLDESQKAEACKKLAELPADQRDIAISSFNKKIASGEIKTPMAYLNALIEKGLKNGLQAAKTAQPIQTPAKDGKTRLEVIQHFVVKHKTQFLSDFEKNRAVFIQGIGVLYKDELKLAGLFD